MSVCVLFKRDKYLFVCLTIRMFCSVFLLVAMGCGQTQTPSRPTIDVGKAMSLERLKSSFHWSLTQATQYFTQWTQRGQWHRWNLSRDMACVKLEAYFGCLRKPCVKRWVSCGACVACVRLETALYYMCCCAEWNIKLDSLAHSFIHLLTHLVNALIRCSSTGTRAFNQSFYTIEAGHGGVVYPTHKCGRIGRNAIGPANNCPMFDILASNINIHAIPSDISAF